MDWSWHAYILYATKSLAYCIQIEQFSKNHLHRDPACTGLTLAWVCPLQVFETAANATVHFGVDYDRSPCFLHVKLNNGFDKDTEGLGIWTEFILQDEMKRLFYENLNVEWAENNAGQTVLDASLEMYLGEQQEMFYMQVHYPLPPSAKL